MGRTLKKKTPRRTREPVGVSTTELSIQIHDIDTRLVEFIAAVERRQYLVDGMVETLGRILRTVERTEDQPSRASERTLLIEVRRVLTELQSKPSTETIGRVSPFTAAQVVDAIDAARATRSGR
jgi:hypothetical protein